MLPNSEIDRLITLIVSNKQNSEVNIFLCGKSSKDDISLRESINNSLSKNPRLSILYPEWLFHNLVEQQNYDLLSLEMKLANDVDTIILPLEGVGTYSELGSFVISDITRSKLLVINDIKYIDKKESYIHLGPLRLIKKSKIGEVVYRDFSKHDDIVHFLEERFKQVHSVRKLDHDSNNFFTLTYIVGLFIFIYEPITKGYLEYLLRKYDPDINRNFIDPTIEFLFRKEHIESNQNQRGEEVFSMTKKGQDDYIISFEHLGKVKVFYKIKNISLWTKPKNGYNFSNTKERARLLDNT